MLIGIDMLGVQSPGGDVREAGRLGRRLVESLLGRDPANRYVLYVHEGLPTDRVPTARNALRVTLSGGLDGPSRVRPAIQRVLDHNPDGLDWLVLLDPFAEGYGGLPPESPLNGVKVASVVLDLAPARVDDRRLAPLRKHDAILAFSGSAAAEGRRRLPLASRRIATLGPASDESWTSSLVNDPLGIAGGDELGRLGIDGPFLLASLADGAGLHSDLGEVLEAFHRLPLDLRDRHRLVIAGEVADPWAAIAYLHDHGCAEALVLVGSVDEPTLRTLYGRCSAYLSPGSGEGSNLSLIDALGSGAPVVASRTGAKAEVVGDAGLLAGSADPSEIAGLVASVLTDANLGQDLRRRALARAGAFSWEPVVQEILEIFQGVESNSSTRRFRFDSAHIARPRIALFATAPRGRSATADLGEQVAWACRSTFDVDLYIEPEEVAFLEGLPVEFGGFDARQFARNDAILDYHAIVSILPDVFSVKARLDRFRDRPGLVLLQDETSLDRIGPETNGSTSMMTDVEAEVACQRLRELFLTSTRLALRSHRDLEGLRSTFPGFADRIFAIPASESGGGPGLSRGLDRFPEVLASLIDGCAADLNRGRGRSRGYFDSPRLATPTATHALGAAVGLDEFSQETG